MKAQAEEPQQPHATAQELEESLFLLMQAVRNRLSLHVLYNGRDRFICPHVLGYSANRRLMCLAYQFAGESDSRPIQPMGSEENWRCMEVGRMEILNVFSSRWYTAETSRQRDEGSRCVVHPLVTVGEPGAETDSA